MASVLSSAAAGAPAETVPMGLAGMEAFGFMGAGIGRAGAEAFGLIGAGIGRAGAEAFDALGEAYVGRTLAGAGAEDGAVGRAGGA